MMTLSVAERPKVSGVYISSALVGGTVYEPGSARLPLGASIGGNSQGDSLKGKLDDVSIYDRALSAGELLAIASAACRASSSRWSRSFRLAVFTLSSTGDKFLRLLSLGVTEYTFLPLWACC